jgi:hypothetical protein
MVEVLRLGKEGESLRFWEEVRLPGSESPAVGRDDCLEEDSGEIWPVTWSPKHTHTPTSTTKETPDHITPSKLAVSTL